MFQGMTPWGPILSALGIALGGAAVTFWITRNWSYAAAGAFFVLALASAALGMIATVGFVAAAVFAVLALGFFVAGVSQARSKR